MFLARFLGGPDTVRPGPDQIMKFWEFTIYQDLLITS